MHTYLYIYTSILKSKYELWKYNSDTSVSAFAMTISRRKSHLTSPSAAYFSTFVTKTLLKSSAISKISLTLSTATMTMVVCRRLIASLLMSNGYARQSILRSPTPRLSQRGVGERRERAGPGRGRSGERHQLCKSCKMFFLGKVAETAYICTVKQQEVQHFQNTSMETQKIYNLVILDASGSMEVIYNQALTGVNETLATIRRAQETHPELQQYVTLASFSAGDDFLNRIYSAKPIAEARNITSADYPLLGCTALYDAMGTCISELQQRVCHGDRVLVTIITDGYENASRTWNGRQIKSLVQELRQMGWTFTYIGADQDVEKVAGEIGVCNALRFSANAEETAAMFEKEGRSRTRFYSKVCCEMRAPDASLAEMDDYFADDDSPEALEDILKSEAKGNR